MKEDKERTKAQDKLRVSWPMSNSVTDINQTKSETTETFAHAQVDQMERRELLLMEAIKEDTKEKPNSIKAKFVKKKKGIKKIIPF